MSIHDGNEIGGIGNKHIGGGKMSNGGAEEVPFWIETEYGLTENPDHPLFDGWVKENSPEDIIDGDDTTSADKISALCDELKRFLLNKNANYGDSALKPIKVFSKGDSGDNIDARMDDKLSRIVESEEQRKNDFVDLTGYLVLKCIEKGWTDFSDLID